MKFIYCLLVFVICDIWTWTTHLHVNSFEFNLDNTNSNPPGRSPNYSYSDSWTSEELWPKDNSIIHVKLISPAPKSIPVWEPTNLNYYLSDQNLDFDSPFEIQSLNNCLIEYNQFRGNQQQQQEDGKEGLIQAQISGSKCTLLPLNSLKFFDNLTHIIIRNTGIVNLNKFVFGAAKLEKLTRIDIIDNKQLKVIQSRAFDGLTRLIYLSFINNKALYDVNQIEIFVGLKNLEELIWINNNHLNYRTFFTLIRASSVRILPNLIHLHISGPEDDVIENDSESDSENVESDQSALKLSDDENQDRNDTQQVNRRDSNDIQKNILRSGIKINKDEFVSLTQIKYLQLANCDIRMINPLSFLPLKPKLIGLNLSGNKKLNVANLKQTLITTFQMNSSSAAIKWLDISGLLSFKSIPKDLLTVISKTKITQLYLNKIPIKEIVIGDVPPMPLLKTLYIESTQLEYIEESAMNTLEELEKLSLKGNYLTTIPPTFVSDLPKLQYLDLSGYKFNRTPFEIPHKTFIGTNVKEVNLSYKLLDPLPRNAFLGLFKMQRFHLRGCGLKWVEYLTFFPLKSIIYIDLSENEELISTLRETHEDSFFGLEAVQQLRMSQCNLTAKDINDSDSIFKRLHEHVELLDLSWNQIDWIGPTTFSNFTELQHLNLSHNQIKPWANVSIFSKNFNIQTFDISNNALTHMTSSMLEDFHRIKNLSFAINPLRCDCQSQIVMDWLNDNPGIYYINHRNPLYSKSQYYCISNDNDNNQVKISFRSFIQYCKTHSNTRVSLALLSGITSILLLFTLVILIIAFIYHSTLHSLFTGYYEDDNFKYEYDAFVSYNVNDSEWVFKHLVPNLENSDNEYNHIKLCVYDRDFIAGRPISECILESIKTSRKVILVISNNFVKSPWCRFETDLAHNTLMDQNRDGLIMIKLEELDYERIAPQLHFLLKTRIYLQWNGPGLKEQEIFFKKLRRALGFNVKKQQLNGKPKTLLTKLMSPSTYNHKNGKKFTTTELITTKTPPAKNNEKIEIIECNEKNKCKEKNELNSDSNSNEIIQMKVPIAS